MATLHTPVYDASKAAGATFGQWHQWELPVSFGDPAKEYLAAGEGVAVHDASYLGRIKATGEDVLDLLNRLSTNQVENLAPGEGAPTILTSDKGRVVDLVYVFNLGSYVLLLTSPGAEEPVMEWVDRYTIMEDSSLEDLTPRTALLTLVGPKAPAAIEAITTADLQNLGPYRSASAAVGGLEVSVMRMDVGKLPGYLLMAAEEDAEAVWEAVVSHGATPVGTGAWEALRVEAAIPVYGKEMGEAFNPLEAGLIGAIDFAKGCYIGQEVIARLDTYQKVQRRLVSLKFSSHSSAKEGAKLALDGKEVGIVTSAAQIPTDSRVMGLGYVRTAAAIEGNRLTSIGDGEEWVEISGTPLLFGQAGD